MKDSDTTEYEAHTDLSPVSVTAQLEGDNPGFSTKIRFECVLKCLFTTN